MESGDKSNTSYYTLQIFLPLFVLFFLTLCERYNYEMPKTKQVLKFGKKYL